MNREGGFASLAALGIVIFATFVILIGISVQDNANVKVFYTTDYWLPMSPRVKYDMATNTPTYGTESCPTVDRSKQYCMTVFHNVNQTLAQASYGYGRCAVWNFGTLGFPQNACIMTKQ